MVKEVKVLIIGAGPTGLGAATRLHQLGESDWALVDAADRAGGLSATDVTPEGFLFDVGGHVTFSHYSYFDELIDHAVGTGSDVWAVHQRISYIYLKNKMVPYPFQNNLAALPPDDQISCLTGLITSRLKPTKNGSPHTFDEWISKNLGEGIANIFMRPYNFKVWATKTDQMQCKWLGERVATVDLEKVLRNVLKNELDAGWGPNATFRYPQEGGTGGVWISVAKLLPENKQHYNCKVVGLDINNKLVTTNSGKSFKYKYLISTMPLDCILSLVDSPELATGLRFSHTHVIGIGVRGERSHVQSSWLYYPEDNCPFYRVTIFSNYGRGNVPNASKCLPTLRTAGSKQSDHSAKPGPYWSIMCEVSESDVKPVQRETLIEDTIAGAINVGLLKPNDEIVSVYHRIEEHGYPVPNLGRDAALEVALPWLKNRDVWSRGRFGSYKYEVGNQDHSLMLGVEAINNILFGEDEITLTNPDYVNSGAVRDKLHYHKDL